VHDALSYHLLPILANVTQHERGERREEREERNEERR
jgi:hypothetical protein